MTPACPVLLRVTLTVCMPLDPPAPDRHRPADPAAEAGAEASCEHINALARAAAAGSSAAFAELVTLHQRRVFSMASKYARNHHELEDLAQDIFIRIWRGLPSWRASAPFGHWLGRVAIRACYDFLRRHRLRREKEVSSDSLALEVRNLIPSTPHPQQVEESYALLRVRRAMDRLHAKDQLILNLIELEDRSVRETAALTGWSEANVKVRAHRARLRLRTILESLPDEPDP